MVTTPQQSFGRYHSLDSIRGIAAFVVLLGHCYGVLPVGIKAGISWLKAPGLLFFVNGRAAVMVFFVLSGFVLSLPWFSGRAPVYKDFIIRRICRIYIPFAVAIAASALLFLLVPHPPAGEGNDWAAQTWGGRDLGAAGLSGHFLMTGIWGHIFLDSPIWSLVHEMRASIVFPLLVLLCGKTTRGIIVTAVGLLAAMFAVHQFGAFRDFPIITDSFFSTVLATFFVLPAFMLGILLAQNRAAIGVALSHVPAAGRVALWGLSAGVFATVASFEQGAAWMLASGLLISLVISSDRAAKVLRIAPIKWLGRVSYSLYLVHVPVLFALICVMRDKFGYGVIIPVAIIAALVASEIMCRFVELPAIRLGKKLTGQKSS